MEITRDTQLIVMPGAQRAGTTTLYDALTRHSKVHPLVHPSGGVRKEVEFFALKAQPVAEKVSWYTSLFGEENGMYLDASTAYLMSPEAPKLISQVLGPVKYIVTLRDPVERAYSGWMIMHRKDPPADPRPFEEIIDFIWRHRGEEGIAAAENRGIRKAIREGLIDPDYLSNNARPKHFPRVSGNLFQDPLWPYKYLQYSMYSQRLKPYWDSDSDVMVLCMEELIHEPDRVLRGVYEYLGIKPEDIELGHKNKVNRRTPLLRWWKEAGHFLRKSDALERLLNSHWVSAAKTALRPRLSARNYKKQYLTDSAAFRTRELLSEEYTYWQENRPTFIKSWKK